MTDDTISRQAVLNTIKEWFNSDGDTHLLEQIKALEAQPNEDVLYMEYMRGFNKGKASRIKYAYWTDDFKCSNCGCKCYPMEIDFGDYNYCPNCSADMRGIINETEIL